MAFLGRWGSLLALLPERPREFYDRVTLLANLGLEVLIAERLFGRPPQYREVASKTVSWEDFLQDIEARFDHVAEILDEPALSDIEKSVRRRYEDNRSKLPVDPAWGADPITARCCYLACRLLKPTTVVECGVS